MNIELIRKFFLISSISAILLLSVGLVGLIILQPRAERSFGDIPLPKIESIINEKIEISSSIRVVKKPKDAKLTTVYKKTEILSEEDLAKSLGFSTSPQKIREELYWKENSKTLRTKPPTTRFTYLNTSEIKEGVVSSDEAEDIAKSSLIKLGLVSEDDELVVIKVRTLITSGGEGREATKK